MHLINTINIERYHKDKIDKYGLHTPRSLGWRTHESQIIRFEILSKIGNLSNSSILDAGCGHGDLCGFINQRYSNVRYFGVDINDAFLDTAIEKYGNINETAFFKGDFSQASLPITDYILLSGSLNYRNSNPHFTIEAISHLFQSCRIAFGFNMLSYVAEPESFLVSHNMTDIVRYCKTLTHHVLVKENYLENDFTIFMYH